MRKTVMIGVALAVMALCLPGCHRRTPEERLQKAVSMAQNRDPLGATLEARELIQKFPDDPRAIDAHLLLARIYYADQRPDESLTELKTVFEKISQKDPRGQGALAQYLAILRQQKRFDEALTMIEKYQKEYASDAGTSLSFTVARADTLTQAGQTTSARTTLMGLHESTTTPKEAELYADMIVKTFTADGNPELGMRFYQQQFEKAQDAESRRNLAVRIAIGYKSQDDYEGLRKWTEEGTKLFDAAMKDELDANRKIELALDLAGWYSNLGNLEGTRIVTRSLFDAKLEERYVPAVINELVLTFLRQGKSDDAIKVLREGAARYPKSPLADTATRLETMKAAHELDRIQPRDTSPLVMRFSADALIVPTNLPPRDASRVTTGTIENTPTTETVAVPADAQKPAGQKQPESPDTKTATASDVATSVPK
jgi:TolA-binding protein